jgi:hypothetical protein
MIEQDVIDKLAAIPDSEWKQTIKKCYSHLRIKLYNKTSSGAHTEQRLGMNPLEYYFSNAYMKVCSGKRAWNYKEVSIDEHLISVMDSLMNSEVKKYKVEQKHNRMTVLVEPDQLSLFNKKESHETTDEDEMAKLKKALNEVCEENGRYKLFVDLTSQGLDYDAICGKMKCDKKEAYRIKEAIVKKAKKKMKSI